MEAGRHVPEDFASFVATQEPRLRAASQQLTGNDRLAALLRRDLLASVAMRWWWIRLRPARRRASVSAAYLDRIVRREAHGLRLEPSPRASRAADPEATSLTVVETEVATRLADEAWVRAGAMRRQRWLVAAGIAAVLGCMVVIGPRPAPPPPGPDVVPRPTAVPTGVLIVPPFAQLAGLPYRATALPETIDIDPTPAPPLLSQPLARAVAVMRQGLGALIVVAPDGATRRVDDPRLAAARLLTTSLSPAGTRVALARANDLLVVDVTTGEVRSVAVGASQPSAPSVVWSSDRSVMMPSLAGARVVDTDTGALADLADVGAADLVTVQGAPPRLAEVMFGAPAAGQPARIRLWRSDPTPVPVVAGSSPSVSASTPLATQSAPPSPPPSPPPSSPPSSPPTPAPSAPPGNVEDRPIFGPPWIGGWLDAAWSTADTFIRACGTGNLALPAGSGTARSAVVAVGLNGLYLATLVGLGTTNLEALGFIDAQTVLIAAGLPQTATIVLAWNPRTSDLRRVATVSAYSQIALADLHTPQ